MRLGFAGTPAFAQQALAALLAARHELAFVLTQPDRPAGRGMKMQPSPVKSLALAHGLHVAQPAGLRLDGRHAQDAHQAQALIEQTRPQALVVAAYGLILPRWVLDLPPGGCLNIHASLLPRWRGAAPIHRAIEAGDTRTGVSIMQMDEGLDTGDMLLCESMSIGARETTGQLHDRLAELGARLITQALTQAEAGTLPRTPQPAEGPTYANKVDKAETRLDWHEPAVRLDRRIRAFDPAPGMVASYQGHTLKCWAATPLQGQGAPGTVLHIDDQGIEVACGQGSLLLTQLQRSGGKRMPAREFLSGLPEAVGLTAGGVFDLPAA